MVLSLIVVLAAVGVVLAITWRPEPDPIKRVDSAPLHALAAAQAGYRVLDPQTQLDGFVPTSVRWEATPESVGSPVWHVGGVYRDEYLQITQSSTTEPGYLAEQTAGGSPIGTVDIDGASWEQRESSSRRSLVLQRDGVTTVVSGTLGWEALDAVAAQVT